MRPSATRQVTGGDPDAGSLSLDSSARRWPRQFVMVDWHSAGMSCVASSCSPDIAGSPSGMAAKTKPGTPSSAAAPREARRRRWLNSVLTRVTWKPRAWSSLARCSVGVMSPCDGYGTHTACGGLSPVAPIADAILCPLISLQQRKRDR
ncbi:Os04g0314201 [Oryza sativa Japonica Group]|uniref:Os04g0314201 protein n=1 Tax=Oryza sativa subsp. japonica TaxID=39947 RepID=A0A0N7KIT9_ORYSJ|nr:Os04g0314201 [Oryza sativa Japonica Group]